MCLIVEAACSARDREALEAAAIAASSPGLHVMPYWKVWAFAAVLPLLAAGYALLSFVAAADLGYDADPRGREIMTRWGYGAILLVPAGTACALMAWRSRRSAKG